MTSFSKPGSNYIAVIDIGSNSVRLVVFSGLSRVPDVIFNEKMMCGLGQAVGATGRMDEVSIEAAMATLRRFSGLCRQMGVCEVHALATAAVRDAENGAEFVARVRAECGLSVKVISGEEEGRLAGLGVLAGQPGACGIMGDLGGGSLELAEIGTKKTKHTISLPVGPLRLTSSFNDNMSAIKKHLRQEFAKIPWLTDRKRPELYLVGGAWRNICKLMLWERANNLTVLHGYRINDVEIRSYCRRLMGLNGEDIPFANQLPARRREVLPTAALILSELVKATHAKNVVLSTYGIREGFIFDTLSDETRSEDPFLHSCRVLAHERCRFPEHADAIYGWSRPLFAKSKLSTGWAQRLHLAICLLSDVAWRGHPDFRAEKAVETILHGNFVGVTHKERAFVAVALNQSYGAPIEALEATQILPLLDIAEIIEARTMGGALRLAQRISGGTIHGLDCSRLDITGRKLRLRVDSDSSDIINDVVEKRFRQLAQLVGLGAEISFDDIKAA